MQQTTTFDTRFKNLNSKQKEAVLKTEGPLLVIAGPGSGKTELLSIRIANILKTTDTPPESILCLTFTEAAQSNMLGRLRGLIGKEAYKIPIHTFHSFANEIIGQNPEYFYKGAIYEPIDDLNKKEILEKILKNLKYSSPLKSYHPEQGYTYLKSIENKIENLKKGGLTPSDFKDILTKNQQYLQKANPLFNKYFSERISKKSLDKIKLLIAELEEIQTSQKQKEITKPNPTTSNNNRTDKNLSGITSIKTTLISTLTNALEEAQQENSTKPISVLKKELIKKDKNKNTVLKDFENLQKHIDLAYIYEKYQEELTKRGFYDFNDMILDVIKALQKYPDLKYSLQEKYLYFLIDEFQDTSGVQNLFLDQIINTEINNNKPNVMAVGDDDQSIYKFQGANLENILRFHKKYDETKLIVLDKNYRSTQEILNLARPIIQKGEERLENQIKSISKNLKSENKALKKGSIQVIPAKNSLEEYDIVANQILKLSKTTPFSEIAILSRNHKDLTAISQILDNYQIPVFYKQKKNLLEHPIINQLITIIKFTSSILEKDNLTADYLLPEILSYPFWEIPAINLWQVSQKARLERKSWFELILEDQSFKNTKLKKTAIFLLELSKKTKTESIEDIFDFIIGSRQVEKDTNTDDITPRDVIRQLTFKGFYFSNKNFNQNRTLYLDYLEALTRLFELIREHNQKSQILAKDFLDFISIYENHQLPLFYETTFGNEKEAVNLMSVHGSKGLEFDTVFIISALDRAWFSGARSYLKLPLNLPLETQKDNEDDRLRLLYVAITRAKRNLFISYPAIDAKGKETKPLRFLENIETSNNKKLLSLQTEKSQEIPRNIEQAKSINLLENNLEAKSRKILSTAKAKDILRERLKNYKLNVTHLNNFIDVTNGGPMNFLEMNLLMFPQKAHKSASFGTAIHNTLDFALIKFKKDRKLPSERFFKDTFTQILTKQKLNKEDFNECLERGIDNLSFYYKNKTELFTLTDKTEINFFNQNVFIENVPLSGKIDKMEINTEKKIIKVCDYKTGKALYDFTKGKSDYEKIKGLKYKNQLIFYKLLVENSREFGRQFKVNNGYLDFVENDNGTLKTLETFISDEDTKELSLLIKKIYEKIMNLDFPDVSNYEQSYKGIIKFIEDLKSL